MGMSLAMGLSLTANRRAGGAWSPSQLLAGASQLAYYDPSDLTTLFQDSAGTTPVTADGQSVGRVLDKSGNGNHLIQTTLGSRPLYKTDGTLHWLQFDGTDDFLVSAANLDPGAVDKAQVFAGVLKASDAARGILMETGAATIETGYININAPIAAALTTFSFRSCGNPTTALADAIATPFAAPTTNVVAALGDISGDTSTIRIDGNQSAQSTADQGTGNYLSYPLYVGRRAGTSLPFNGNIYSLLIRFSAANLDAAVIDSAEAWTAGKCGVTL